MFYNETQFVIGFRSLRNLLEMAHQLVKRSISFPFFSFAFFPNSLLQIPNFVVKKNLSQFLLSQQGYDPDKMSSTINRLDLANTFEPLEPLSETDIEVRFLLFLFLFLFSFFFLEKKKMIEK